MGSERFASSRDHRGGVPAGSGRALGVGGLVERFGLGALRIMLGVGASFVALDLVIAVVEGDDGGQIAVGIVSSVAWLGGLVWFDRAATLLRRPRRVEALVVIVSAGVAAAGTWNSPYTTEVFALIAVATVVASGRGVAVCVALATAGYVGGLLVEGTTPAQLVDGRHAGVVANNIGDFILFAVVLLVALNACRRVLGSAREIIGSARAGGATVTPELGLALRRADRHVGLLPRARAADIVAGLSDAERAVLRQLSVGLLPKQVAQQTGTPMGTVRRQIAAAKRKTGVRTVEQLVALVAEADMGP